MALSQQLQTELINILKQLDLEFDLEQLQLDTSLIKSGLLDSLALFQLATWMQQQIAIPIDFTQFDLLTEWDTIADMVYFIERHQSSVDTNA